MDVSCSEIFNSDWFVEFDVVCFGVFEGEFFMGEVFDSVSDVISLRMCCLVC